MFNDSKIDVKNYVHNGSFSWDSKGELTYTSKAEVSGKFIIGLDVTVKIEVIDAKLQPNTTTTSAPSK